MNADQLLDIFALMDRYQRDDSDGSSLCRVAATVTELSGAGIMLSSANDQLTGLCRSSPVAEGLMDLEITVREGPGFDACRGGVIIEEPDLLAPQFVRWTRYAPTALELGARAVFGFPVRLGVVRFGALCLVRDRPGPLSGSQVANAHLMASVVGRAILSMQAGAPAGELAGELKGNAVLDFSVHQAAGMVAVQGSLSVKDALVTLRAHAYATGDSLADLSAHVVARSIRFEASTGTWTDKELK